MITTPWFNSAVECTAFNAYAYHQQSIEDFIDALAKNDNPNDPINQRSIARYVGLDFNSLTNAEISYIEEEVSKRC